MAAIDSVPRLPLEKALPPAEPVQTFRVCKWLDERPVALVFSERAARRIVKLLEIEGYSKAAYERVCDDAGCFHPEEWRIGACGQRRLSELQAREVAERQAICSDAKNHHLYTRCGSCGTVFKGLTDALREMLAREAGQMAEEKHYHTYDFANGSRYVHLTKRSLDQYLAATGREHIGVTECTDTWCVEQEKAGAGDDR